MSSLSVVFLGLWFVAAPVACAQIQAGELVAPKMEISGGNLNFTIQPTLSGRNYQLQYSDTMAGGTWTDLGVVRSGDGSNLVITTPYVAGVSRRFYRVALVQATAAPTGFALISAGSFQMGDQSSPQVGYSAELPVHTVQLSKFYMAKNLVTKEAWDPVRAWGLTHGYTDLNIGASKAANHPVQTISWYDVTKWCNARSEKEGLAACYTVSGVVYRTGGSDPLCVPVCNWSANGYRLPSEAEWEKAARGGLSGQNFPWGNTITHSQANYYAQPGSYPYDVSLTSGYHPTYGTSSGPYTSPVGSFAPNGYGLYDMSGNQWEWCWDRYGGYTAGSQTDSRGPVSGGFRVFRGGAWYENAGNCRVASRGRYFPFSDGDNVGFRIARSSVP